jgi:hypothetical protein
MTKILVGILGLFMTALIWAAPPSPTSTAAQRARAIRAANIVDEPVATTSTTAAPAVPEPEVTTTTVPAPTTVTTEIRHAATPNVPVATPQSGHYICPAGMDSTTQFDGPDCVADNTIDPGPANASPDNDPNLPNGADGDQPDHTLGSTDPAYGADLTAKSCAIKPWLCGDGWTR